MINLSYKNYEAKVTFEVDSDVYVGRLQGISDIVVFESETIEKLEKVFHEAVDDYILHKR